MEKQPATYILASRRNGTLYIGVTSDPIARIWQHRQHAVAGFSDRYGVTRLVWYQLHATMEAAIHVCVLLGRITGVPAKLEKRAGMWCVIYE